MVIEQKDSSMTLKDLFVVIKDNFTFILGVMVLGFVLSASYSLIVTPIYASTALIAPNSSENSSQGLASALSDFSGLIDISSMSSGGVSRSEVAYQKLMSKEFFRVLYENEQFIKDFFAVRNFDVDSKEVTYYESWEDSKPHFQKAYEDFHRINFNVAFNRKTGLINLILKNKSSQLAAKWLKEIIQQVNNYVKEEEKLEAESSLKFLQERLSETSVIEVQKVIAALIQQTLQKLMLAEVTDEYLFDVIDEPFVPDSRSSPKRTQLTIIGTISFGIFALVLSIFSFVKNGGRAANLFTSIKFSKRPE